MDHLLASKLIVELNVNVGEHETYLLWKPADFPVTAVYAVFVLNCLKIGHKFKLDLLMYFSVRQSVELLVLF